MKYDWLPFFCRRHFSLYYMLNKLFLKRRIFKGLLRYIQFCRSPGWCFNISYIIQRKGIYYMKFAEQILESPAFVCLFGIHQARHSFQRYFKTRIPFIAKKNRSVQLFISQNILIANFSLRDHIWIEKKEAIIWIQHQIHDKNPVYCQKKSFRTTVCEPKHFNCEIFVARPHLNL